MITRRTFPCGLTLGTLVAPLGAEAQSPQKVYRIGYLSVPSRDSQDTTKAFERGTTRPSEKRPVEKAGRRSTRRSMN
jgi:hypothetical protein